jgi:hypothetical protein
LISEVSLFSFVGLMRDLPNIKSPQYHQFRLSFTQITNTFCSIN